MSEAINAMSDAFKSLSSNTAIVPSRINMPIMDQNALHLSMPAYIKGGKYIMIKLVNVHYDNPKNNLPLINGIILLMDSKNGIPLAFMDGKSITALRTGASSGLATKILSNQNSKSAVVIGSGVQALSQIEAIRNVRELDSIKVADKPRMHKNSQTFSINYKNYTTINKEVYPKRILFLDSNNKSINIDMKSVAINKKLNIPFKIPRGYNQINVDQ